jgi:acetyl esterase
VADLAMNTDSYKQLGTGYNLTAGAMAWFRDLYLNNTNEITDWRASPMLATNIAGLPPAYIAVAGCDPLHDEGVAFAKLLEGSNVPVTLRDFPGQMHGFASMSGFLKAADEVIADIGAALKKRW